MQIVPATGRRYAQRLGIRPFTTARLTNAEVNIRIGMAYFADLRDRFGNEADALAAYNAGENRLIRWRAERPDVPLDEFIDDIPFPETQHYVKRVLGTAEDYRILYGHLLPAVQQVSER
jgi:soluble lytic murein transglycosylase